MAEVGVRAVRGLSRGGERGPLLSSSARRESADDEDDNECRGESLDAIKNIGKGWKAKTGRKAKQVQRLLPNSSKMGYTLCVLGVWTYVLSESNKQMIFYPGCGTMGIAITSGVIAALDSAQSRPNVGSTTLESPISADASMPSRFLATCMRDPTARKLRNLFQDLGGLGESVEIIQTHNAEAVKRADVILLWYACRFSTQWRNEPMGDSCKPHQAGAILFEGGMRDALHGKLLISILAGMSIPTLRCWVTPETRVIRAMPNTPCKVLVCCISYISFPLTYHWEIREGMTVISTFPRNYPTETMEFDRNVALNIFSSIGRVRFLEEKHFDVSTAIAGSGPAFACLFLEAMADGGVLMGLPRDEALEMAAQSTRVA